MNIGDRIIEVEGSGKRGRTELHVISIGRRWAKLSNGLQIDKDTLSFNGDPYGRQFFTENGYVEWEAKKRLVKLLSDVSYKIHSASHHHVIELTALLEEILEVKEKD
jgi:hypothetical protein